MMSLANEIILTLGPAGVIGVESETNEWVLVIAKGLKYVLYGELGAAG